jgi:hypothetical protein
MKRTGPDSPRRPASPPARPQQAGTPDTDPTESFEDSSDDSVIDPLEQAWACMNDPCRPDPERADAIRRCIAGRPVHQHAGILCLDADHWQLLGGLTLLDAPAECAELFAAAYLTEPGAPLAANQCMQCVEQVKTVRAALAALALHKTTVGCSAVARRVLEMVTLLDLCPLAGRQLLDMAFRGHGALMADVYAALCADIEAGPRPSTWLCFVALASVCGASEGGQLDGMLGAHALCGESDDLASLLLFGLTQCRQVFQVVRAFESGDGAATADDAGMLSRTNEAFKDVLRTCRHSALSAEILAVVHRLQEWVVSLTRPMQ